MDRPSRLLLRSAAKLIAEALNHGEMNDKEMERAHAAYRRIILALGTNRDSNS